MFPYQKKELSPEERTRDLLSRMTVEEKIGQLVKLDGFRSYERSGSEYRLKPEFTETVEKWLIGSMYGLVRADWWTERDWNSGVPPEKMNEVVNLFQKYILDHSRLGIPLYIAEEAPHGLMALGTSVFPTGLGLGASFDRAMMNRVGHVIGSEAHAAGVHSVYAPILDIVREPRWSRTEENYSEDPYLTSVFGEEMVKGISSEGTVATLKHFVAHGSPEGGHNHGPAHVGPIEFRNCQLRPFRNAVRAGALSIMSAYSDVDGEPSSGSRHLLTDILRGELGFKGFVVADRGAIKLLKAFRLADDAAEASARALKAGCDVDEGFLEFHTAGLTEALRRGLIDEGDLDVCAGRILYTKFVTGLFEHPFAQSRPVEILRSAEHEAVALEASRKAMTLLKNNGILPLKNIRSLAVIGPNADNMMNQLGDYSAPQKRETVVTVLDGIRAEAEKAGVAVSYARGCGIRSMDKSGFDEALSLASEADATVLVLGGCSTKYGTEMVRTETGAAVPEILSPEKSEKESGEGTDRATFTLSGVQMELFRALKAAGKPVIVVLVQGRPLEVGELRADADGLLLAWYPGMFGGRAVAEVLFGKYNPAGRLSVSIPRCSGQLPVYYNSLSWRLDYVDCPASPELPFGFGLSYTTFAYSDLKVEGRTASVTVANTGSMDGEEVVQFYLTDLASQVRRPLLELCGFERVFIPAGEKRTVSLELTDEVLGYYNGKLEFVVEPGRFELRAGGNSVDLIQTEFRI